MFRGFQGKACKQKFGNFHFSASRASTRMGVTLSELYELAVFYGIAMMMFGVLLRIWVSLLLYLLNVISRFYLAE